MRVYIERQNFEKLKPYLAGRKLNSRGLEKLNALLESLMQEENLMIKILKNERKRGYRVVEINEEALENLTRVAHEITARTEDLAKTLLMMLIASEEDEKKEEEIVQVEVNIPHDVVQQLLSYRWREEFKELVELSDEETWKKILLTKCSKKDNHIFYYGIEKSLLEKIKKRSQGKKLQSVLCRILTYMVR